MSLQKHHESNGTARVDLEVIQGIVGQGASIIDIGCGTGRLLEILSRDKQVKGLGIEIEQGNVNQCVEKGLSVIQGNADTDLVEYLDDTFDFAILSHALQETRDPKRVLKQLLRIGRKVIVSFHNFGYWGNRTQLLIGGRMPVYRNYKGQEYAWYETPDIHYCTIKDFRSLCSDIDATVEECVVLGPSGARLGFSTPLFMQNLIGEQALFVLTR